MKLTQSLGRAGLSLIVVGALSSACDDGDDPGSTADEQGRADAGAETATRSERAGASAAVRAGRGGNSGNSGNAASTSNNSAAGRAGAGQAGRSSAAANGGAGSSAGTAGVDPARVSLNDGQIVAILAAVNATEISFGTLAMSRAVAEGIRNLGESMVTVHNTAQERQTRLAMSLDLTSEVSPLSTQLGDDAKNLMEELTAADAAEFDALYLRSQVDGHMKVLMLISEMLVPSVQADELRAELMLTRMEVATHLEGARNASSSLEDIDAGAP